MLGQITKNRLRAETEKARHFDKLGKEFNMYIAQNGTIMGLKRANSWSFVDLSSRNFDEVLTGFLNEIDTSEKIQTNEKKI